ncbi:MAG: hypothetical protein LBR34_11880 [Prevotella sp.]|jgi:hypothetical protein|nr:hypothetical protein [Prevotella sp.]
MKDILELIARLWKFSKILTIVLVGTGSSISFFMAREGAFGEGLGNFIKKYIWSPNSVASDNQTNMPTDAKAVPDTVIKIVREVIAMPADDEKSPKVSTRKETPTTPAPKTVSGETYFKKAISFARLMDENLTDDEQAACQDSMVHYLKKAAQLDNKDAQNLLKKYNETW